MNKPNSSIMPGTALDRFQFCPLCGSSKFGNSKENQLVCSQCGFIYYINPPVSVVAILKNADDEILLTQRKYEPGKGLYDFPGGFVDTGESLEKALIREIKEELNLEIKNLNYYDSFATTYPFKGIIYHPVDAVFACHVLDWNTLKIQDDVADISFQSPTHINEKFLAFSSHKLLLKSLQNDCP